MANALKIVNKQPLASSRGPIGAVVIQGPQKAGLRRRTYDPPRNDE